ncbi:hypothetical protein D3C75_1313960 [compost metagenome]
MFLFPDQKRSDRPSPTPTATTRSSGTACRVRDQRAPTPRTTASGTSIAPTPTMLVPTLDHHGLPKRMLSPDITVT